MNLYCTLTEVGRLNDKDAIHLRLMHKHKRLNLGRVNGSLRKISQADPRSRIPMAANVRAWGIIKAYNDLYAKAMKQKQVTP
jgi:hypothetical protein